MFSDRLRVVMGMWVLVCLGASVETIQAEGLLGNHWAPCLEMGPGSHPEPVLLHRPFTWTWRAIAADRSLGFDRPTGVTLKVLDPDYSAAYALGGGLDLSLNSTTVLTTSVQFLWTKIDRAWQRTSGSQPSSSDLSAFNIRAVNLVLGLTARF